MVVASGFLGEGDLAVLGAGDPVGDGGDLLGDVGDAVGVGDVGEEMWVLPQQALIVEFASAGRERR